MAKKAAFQQQSRTFWDRGVLPQGSVYTKSTKMYAKQRIRRRLVRLLVEKGFTQKQIATELGVSTRTVKRDWDKIRSYVKGQCQRENSREGDATWEEFERRYEKLAVNEDLKLLKQDVNAAAKKPHSLQTSPKRQTQPQQPAQQLEYTLDLDFPMAHGFPHVTVPPQTTFHLSEGIQMKFYAIKKRRKKKNY